jgi:hypothetical protein
MLIHPLAPLMAQPFCIREIKLLARKYPTLSIFECPHTIVCTIDDRLFYEFDEVLQKVKVFVLTNYKESAVELNKMYDDIVMPMWKFDDDSIKQIWQSSNAGQILLRVDALVKMYVKGKANQDRLKEIARIRREATFANAEEQKAAYEAAFKKRMYDTYFEPLSKSITRKKVNNMSVVQYDVPLFNRLKGDCGLERIHVLRAIWADALEATKKIE